MSTSQPAIFALASLTLLGFALAPAHAQSLTLKSGDNATVSGSGTVGTIGGQPVANTTSTYSDEGDHYAVQTTGTATFTLQNGGTLDGGQYRNVLDSYSDGAVTVSGGTIKSTGQYGVGINVEGPGSVTIHNVTISGGTISVGDYGYALSDIGNHAVTVTGGSFSAGQNGYGLYADYGSTITVAGGTFSTGAGGVGLYSSSNSTLNLFSFGDSAFTVDGISMNNTTLDGSLYKSGTHTITGTLLDGEALNTTFDDDGGTFNLNVGTAPAAVPEASTIVSLGLLLMLGLCSVLIARKQRVNA